MRQLLTESVLFGLIGGVLGVGLAWLGVRGLMALMTVELPSWMVLRLVASALVACAVFDRRSRRRGLRAACGTGRGGRR